MAVSAKLTRILWNIALAAAMTVATLPAVPAAAAGLFVAPAQAAEGDDGELDGGPDEGAELRRAVPQPDTPSQDGTEDGSDGPPPGGSEPEPFGGCIFEKKPLELLV